MIQIGKINKLQVLESSSDGLYLDDGEQGELWVPRTHQTAEHKVGDTLEVFAYLESAEALVVTSELPIAQVGEFATLTVLALEQIGAFLDWGLPKDLFLPFREQTREIQTGDSVTVFVYLDKANRVTASMRLEKYLDQFVDSTEIRFKENEKVDLMIVGPTDLGFKAIINQKSIGILYSNEIFQPLKVGQKIPGFIKKIRPDGKIDLLLQPMGHQKDSDVSEKILLLLREKGGFLDLTDKTPPEKIYQLFGVSKKKYKMALGGLYKKQLILINDEGIRLRLKA